MSPTPIPVPDLSEIMDLNLIDFLANIFRKLVTLFTIFPVNIFLSLSLASMAIALISKVVSSFRAAN